MNTLNVTLQNEPSYTFGSVDNVRTYSEEWLLEKEYKPSSKHGILLNGEPFAIIGAGGGASGIHEHSILQIDQTAYIAAGDQIVCIDLKEKEKKWNLKIDEATCFGLHYSNRHNAFISHGELEISRFTEEGSILWQTSGRDIFSEGFKLKNDYIEAVDFDGRVYKLQYETGTNMD